MKLTKKIIAVFLLSLLVVSICQAKVKREKDEFSGWTILSSESSKSDGFLSARETTYSLSQYIPPKGKANRPYVLSITQTFPVNDGKAFFYPTCELKIGNDFFTLNQSREGSFCNSRAVGTSYDIPIDLVMLLINTRGPVGIQCAYSLDKGYVPVYNVYMVPDKILKEWKTVLTTEK